MSEQESNICAICGGVKRFEYVIGFEEGVPRDMRVEPDQLGGRRLCPGHPEPAPKHDGKLDEDEQAYWHAEVGHYPYRTEEPRIHISGGYEFEMMLLDPKQALSLRDWLIQESPTLERLAKEQERAE